MSSISLSATAAMAKPRASTGASDATTRETDVADCSAGLSCGIRAIRIFGVRRKSCVRHMHSIVQRRRVQEVLGVSEGEPEIGASRLACIFWRPFANDALGECGINT